MANRPGRGWWRAVVGTVAWRDGDPAGDFAELTEISLTAVGNLIARHGYVDLPWQIAGETISLFSTLSRNYARQFLPALSDAAMQKIREVYDKYIRAEAHQLW
jgi:hypothetical protein